MNPEDAYGILVIILSATLAIFLVLAIIATSLIIRFMRKANNVADSAETIVSNVESLSTSLKDAAGPASLIKVIMSAVQGARRK